MDDIIQKLKDQAPELVKNNKYAVIGAVLGYLLSDTVSSKTKTAVLGAVAGAVLEGKKDE